jgi:hypothetical protein
VVSIYNRLKYRLWCLGVPGSWLFPQHRPSHWWDDVWLHDCDDCGQMIHQGNGPNQSPDADGCYFCDQCGGPYPRLFSDWERAGWKLHRKASDLGVQSLQPRHVELDDSVGADGEGQS